MPARGATVDLRDVSKRYPALRLMGVAAVVVLAAIVGNALYLQRSSSPPLDGGAASAPSPASTTSASATPAPSPDEPAVAVLVGRPAPGNTSHGVLSRVEVVSIDGALVASHDLSGVVSRPAHDGGTRIAYWRRAQGASTFELALWDARTDSSQVLFTTDLRVHTPLWSANAQQLVLVLERDRQSGGKLLVLDVGSATVREVAVYENRPPLYPIYADDRIIAGHLSEGYREAGGEATVGTPPPGAPTSRFVVVDARTGAVRASWSSRDVLVGDQPGKDAVVLGLVANFEAPSHPLYVWRVEAPQDPIAVVEEGELHHPLFRPRHTQVVYGDGMQIKRIDYVTGEVRVLRTFAPTEWGWPAPLAFDEGGDHLLVRSHEGYQVFALRDDQLVVVADAKLPASDIWVFGVLSNSTR